MSGSDFHPLSARWFAERIGEPTPAQVRGWESIRSGRDTLIAAPTGSGKTLAAFSIALDELFRESLHGPLPDEVRVVYVSPLKALSADIHKNLAEPRREIRRRAEAADHGAPHITAAVRSGDTTAAERLAMLKTPPHILVTTPESLYLLLTAERSRAMLRTARTVIVDEIHAVLESRRGAHLALSLERLDHVAGRRLQRVGLSATQRPIEQVAQWLTGSGPAATRKPTALGVPSRHRTVPFGMESAERWSIIPKRGLAGEGGASADAVDVRAVAELARVLLKRYGVVFNRLLAREGLAVRWRDLLLVYRRLEARGEIRGGRFVAGVTGEQFALADAVGQLRAVRRSDAPGQVVAISAADPLNLVGIVTPGDRIPAITRSRILFEDGIPLAVNEGGALRFLAGAAPQRETEIQEALTRRAVSPALRRYLGMPARKAPDRPQSSLLNPTKKAAASTPVPTSPSAGPRVRGVAGRRSALP